MICPGCNNTIQDYPEYCPYCGLLFKEQKMPQYDEKGNEIRPTQMQGEDHGFVDVIFQRRSALTGAAMKLHIIVDEVEVTALGNGQYVQCRIPCGNRKVVLKTYNSTGTYLVNFQNDCRNMRVEVGIGMGWWSANLMMYSVTKEFDNQPPIVDDHQESNGIQ